MKKSLLNKLLSLLLAIVMVSGLLLTGALAIGEDEPGEDPAVTNPAKINDTEYPTLAEALADAEADATIELLGDCTLGSIAISKPVTILGNGNRIESVGTINLLSEITFDNCVISLQSGAAAPGTGDWAMTISSSGILNLVNGTDCTFTVNGIYTSPNAEIHVDASSMSLHDMTYTAMMAEPHAVLTVENGSTFTIDTAITPNGMTSFNITVDDSDFIVKNCSRQGLVNCGLTLLNGATAEISDNYTGYNLYGKNVLTVNDGTTLTMTGNRSAAILMQSSANVLVKAGGTLNVHENGEAWLSTNTDSAYGSKAAINVGWFGWSGGKLYVFKTGVVTFEDGATVNLTGNYVRAISNYGTVTLGEGTVITGNGALSDGQTTADLRIENGGGIQNAGTLTVNPGAVICNNHASVSADDLYNLEGASLTLIPTAGGTTLSDCGDAITGWFRDGYEPQDESDALTTRWNVITAQGNSCETDRDAYFVEYTPAEGAVTELLALKAAHGYIDDTPVVPPTYFYYTVTVNYLNLADNTAVAAPYTTAAAIEGSNYDVSAQDAIAIEGFLYDSTSGDALTGTLNGNKVINVYYTTDAETELPDEQLPTGEQPTDGDEVEITEEELPLGDAPATGDHSAALALTLIMGLCAAGLAVLLCSGRKAKTARK